MSLNFVSSAVLSSTDGVSHNEERPIESAEAVRLRNNNDGAKPLFEQIQFNRDREKEQYEEISKAMRGTRTLDDEDCAHLDSVAAVRMDRERRIQQSIEEEVAEFKAARGLLAQEALVDASSLALESKSTSRNESVSQKNCTGNSEKKANSTPQPPIVVVGRKRRRHPDAGASENANSTKKNSETKTARSTVKTDKIIPRFTMDGKVGDVKVESCNIISAGIGSLLGGYGSDDNSG